MYAALIRASQTWRRVLIIEFELKQIEELRSELDEHLNNVRPRPCSPHPVNEFPANKRLDREINGSPPAACNGNDRSDE